MRRALLAASVLLGCALGSNALATHQGVGKTFVTAKSLDTRAATQSVDAVAQQAINDATAGAIIGTLASQLGDANVQFKLGPVDAKRASLRDVALDGHGLVHLDGATSWIPVRFQALYDTDQQAVESPTITFEPQHARNALDKSVAVGLDEAVDRQLAAEFSGQPVQLHMDNVGAVGGDERFVVVNGEGIADFAAEGKSDITVQGIYDRAAKAWLQVGYRIGGERVDLERTVATR